MPELLRRAKADAIIKPNLPQRGSTKHESYNCIRLSDYSAARHMSASKCGGGSTVRCLVRYMLQPASKQAVIWITLYCVIIEELTATATYSLKHSARRLWRRRAACPHKDLSPNSGDIGMTGTCTEKPTNVLHLYG